MSDTDEIARLRALWCEEKSKSMTFHAEIERLRADLAQRTAERDEAQLQLQRIRCEISCRVEHGADSNGHLEGILAMLKQEAQR